MLFSLLFIIVSFLISNSVSMAKPQSHLSNEPTIKIRSQDFRNTQTIKVCLIASFDAKLYINMNNGRSYNIALPANHTDLSTDGSYCDTDFKSLLVLAIPNAQLNITFKRNSIEADPKKVTYCERCNLGSWTISSIELKISNLGELLSSNNYGLPQLDQKNVSLSAVATTRDFDDKTGSLKTGIVIRRSYFCLNPLHIPMKITNSTTPQQIEVGLDFEFIKVQPFLVGQLEKFLDPQYCDIMVAAHYIIILIPFCYFLIFLIVSRYKERLMCCLKKKDSKLLLKGGEDAAERESLNQVQNHEKL